MNDDDNNDKWKIRILHKWICVVVVRVYHRVKWIVDGIFKHIFFSMCFFLLLFICDFWRLHHFLAHLFVHTTVKSDCGVWSPYQLASVIFFTALLSSIFLWTLQFSFVIKCCSVIYLASCMVQSTKNSIWNRNLTHTRKTIQEKAKDAKSRKQTISFEWKEQKNGTRQHIKVRKV